MLILLKCQYRRLDTLNIYLCYSYLQVKMPRKESYRASREKDLARKQLKKERDARYHLNKSEVKVFKFNY